MKVRHFFVWAGLFVLPFIFSIQGEQMREPKARALILLAGLYLGVELYRKIAPALGCGAFVFFLSAYFTSVIYPFQEALTFTAALISCFWVAHPKKNDIKQGLELLEVSGIIVAFYAMVIQYGGQDTLQRPILGHDFSHPMAFFGQHTLYGPYAVACFASAFLNGRHLRAVLLLLPVLASESSFTFLSLGAVLLVWGFLNLGRRAILGLLMVGAIGLVTLCNFVPSTFERLSNDNGRFRVWGLTQQLIEKRPVFGYGAGSFRLVFPLLQDKKLRELNGIRDGLQSEEDIAFFRDAKFVREQWGLFMHPHNEFLSVFFEFGLVGLVVVAWALWQFASSWIRIGKTKENYALLAIFLAFLVNSIGNFPFHLIPQALLPLWAFVAVTTQKEAGILET